MGGRAGGLDIDLRRIGIGWGLEAWWTGGVVVVGAAVLHRLQLLLAHLPSIDWVPR